MSGPCKCISERTRPKKALTHGPSVAPAAPVLQDKMFGMNARLSLPIMHRTPAEIEVFLDGVEPVEPGLSMPARWRRARRTKSSFLYVTWRASTSSPPPAYHQTERIRWCRASPAPASTAPDDRIDSIEGLRPAGSRYAHRRTRRTL